MAAPPAYVFLSTHHPGTIPWALTYARALVRPLAACMLPVMIVTLVLVLEGHPVLPLVGAGMPAAGLLAMAWTAFRLTRTLAEVLVDGQWAAVRTVSEVARPEGAVDWQPVLDVRDYRRWMLVTIGLTSYEFDRAEWPDYDALREALQQARTALHPAE